jgi:hypothetical protein
MQVLPGAWEIRTNASLWKRQEMPWGILAGGESATDNQASAAQTL